MPFVEPTDDDHRFMRVALEEARRGYDEGGVPVGSVLVENGRLVATDRAGQLVRRKIDAPVLQRPVC